MYGLLLDIFIFILMSPISFIELLNILTLFESFLKALYAFLCFIALPPPSVTAPIKPKEKASAPFCEFIAFKPSIAASVFFIPLAIELLVVSIPNCPTSVIPSLDPVKIKLPRPLKLKAAVDMYFEMPLKPTYSNPAAIVPNTKGITVSV